MLKKLSIGAHDWVSNYRKRLSDRRLERGMTKKLTMCKKCYSFYYRKSWHFYRPESLEMGRDIDREVEIPVRFTECPVCLEQEAGSYEMEPSLSYGI